MDKIKLIEEEQLKKGLPEFSTGDQVKVLIKTLEGDKVRIHPFEGLVIGRRGQGMGATFTLRKISFGESIERTFTLHSPAIEKIEVVKKGKVKRAKIYYMKERFGKSSKVEEAK